MDDHYQKCVVALIWFGDKIMLAKRKTGKHWKGHYAAIGGKVEQGESLIEAMVREIHEESELYIYWPLLQIKDCHVYPKHEEKGFFFETKLHTDDFAKVSNTEPKKRANWELFTQKEALELKLIPRLKELIINTDFNRLKKYC